MNIREYQYQTRLELYGEEMHAIIFILAGIAALGILLPLIIGFTQ